MIARPGRGEPAFFRQPAGAGGCDAGLALNIISTIIAGR
jgi:hypothetical protein